VFCPLPEPGVNADLDCPLFAGLKCPLFGGLIHGPPVTFSAAAVS
jgi:hypothetical protein